MHQRIREPNALAVSLGEMTNDFSRNIGQGALLRDNIHALA